MTQNKSMAFIILIFFPDDQLNEFRAVDPGFLLPLKYVRSIAVRSSLRRMDAQDRHNGRRTCIFVRPSVHSSLRWSLIDT